MEHRVGFEPTALRFCRPFHWTSLAPVHVVWRTLRDLNSHQRFWRPVCCRYTKDTYWCLWQDSNLHTQAYLACALARYKLASLPLSYRGKNLERVARIELANQLWQSCRLPLHHTRIIVAMFFCENSSCSLRGFVTSIERPSCHSVKRHCAYGTP